MTPSSSLLEKATGISFYTQDTNGTRNVTYRNGTIALFQENITAGTELFLSYVVPPTSYFVSYVDSNIDNNVVMRTFANSTIRYIYPALSATPTRYDIATQALFLDVYPNSTSRKYFRNGTIAVYFQGSFIQYDVTPDYMYIDYPVIDYTDGSYQLFFFNGTKRFYTPALTALNTARENKTSLQYTDCFPTGICNFVYRNATIAVYQDGSFVKVVAAVVANTTTPPITPVTPPTPVVVNPTAYAYVNKTGPKKEVYDATQGGIKKYKESKQSTDNRATLSSAAEPLCKGRNQMIIMADKRISSSVYLRRVLQVTDNNSPSSVSLNVQSVSFVPSGARIISVIAYSAALALAALMIFF